MKCDILIAGVGGQGQVLASRLLGAAAIDAGFDARTSETIGMSQRGGSVTSSVRVGGGVLSPLVPDSGADLILGFEICETVRNLKKLSKTGAVVLNTQVISPVSVSLGISKYDSDEMLDFIKSKVKRFVAVDACEMAIKAGSIKAANVVMLGAACGAGFLPFEKERFVSVIINNVPEKFKALNGTAFEYGYNYAAKLK
ncbi:MAG: indolepyruvate oxidoreductase subunit beta [[Clostridium] cellulosi]|jgi:Pyruvate ferredoxin/flavodoxin oxidoreductase.